VKPGVRHAGLLGGGLTGTINGMLQVPFLSVAFVRDRVPSITPRRKSERRCIHSHDRRLAEFPLETEKPAESDGVSELFLHRREFLTVGVNAVVGSHAFKCSPLRFPEP
jgi:hypothetical protein